VGAEIKSWKEKNVAKNKKDKLYSKTMEVRRKKMFNKRIAKRKKQQAEEER
jgi:hypothetical protein